MTKIDINSMTAALDAKIAQRQSYQQQQQLKYNHHNQQQDMLLSNNSNNKNSTTNMLNDSINDHAGAPSMIVTRDNSSASSTTTSSKQSANNNQSIQYLLQQYNKPWTFVADGVIGNGSFGVVYMATVIETNELVAIKKVLYDKKYKNRELQLMCIAQLHPCIIQLKHCFYSKSINSHTQHEQIYLNLVMEYINDTLYHCCKLNYRANRYIQPIYVKLYMYQLLRSLAHLHGLNICHRDIKPQNILLNTKTHEIKLCDFGSAKQLVSNEANVSYICSRFYRAPELIFDSTNYTNAIDIWSLGCVYGEMLLGTVLFTGDTGIDQLIEIIRICGTPTPTQILAMSDKPTTFTFPLCNKQSWQNIFKHNTSVDAVAIDLLEQMLQYNPTLRVNPLVALTHPYFNELRAVNAILPNNKPIPHIYDLTSDEIQHAYKLNILRILVPPHGVSQCSNMPDEMMHIYNNTTNHTLQQYIYEEKSNSPIKLQSTHTNNM